MYCFLHATCLEKIIADTDESTHSLVVALNDDYSGGGTYFYDHDTTVRPEQGWALSFAGGDMLHGGEAVTAGVRYILAAFLYHDDNTIEEEELMGTSYASTKAAGGDPSSKREAVLRKRGGNPLSRNDNNDISKVFRECKQQKTAAAFSFGFEVEQQ